MNPINNGPFNTFQPLTRAQVLARHYMQIGYSPETAMSTAAAAAMSESNTGMLIAHGVNIAKLQAGQELMADRISRSAVKLSRIESKLDIISHQLSQIIRNQNDALRKAEATQPKDKAMLAAVKHALAPSVKVAKTDREAHSSQK